MNLVAALLIAMIGQDISQATYSSAFGGGFGKPDDLASGPPAFSQQMVSYQSRRLGRGWRQTSGFHRPIKSR